MSKQLAYLYLLIVRANGIYNHSKPIELVDLDICPFTNFCHRKATAGLKEDLVPCCTPCSCSDNCWEQGNCCPDKDIIGHRVSELECVLAMVKESKPAGRIAYNGYKYGIKRYRIVTSCPKEEYNKTLVEKCAGHDKTSILDYTWVTDKSTGMIFQNEYCARCHNVDRYFKWQIRTTYSPAMLANLSSLPNSIHSRHCELMVELPDDKVHLADKYRCYKADRVECNITSLWRDYDASVDLACRTYVSPIVTYIQKSLMYKNIYCYYCNGLKGQQFAQSCLDLSDERNGILSKSFSALIDFTERQPSGVESLCSQNEIFDIFIICITLATESLSATDYQNHVCHTLWCPFGSASWYGSCIDIAIETQGLTVSIIYKLELKWKDSSVSGQHSNLPEDETLGELIQESFLKAFNVKLNNLKMCRHCRLNVWISERTKTQLPEVVLLQLNLFTDSQCQLDAIFDQSKTIIGKVIEVPVNESVLVSAVGLEKRLSSVKGMKLSYRFLVTPCNPIYHIDKDKVCPEIEVNSLVLKSKIKDISVLSGIMGLSGNQTNLPDNNTIKLCWDDYVSMMTEAHAGTAALTHKHVTPAITLLQFIFTLIFL